MEKQNWKDLYKRLQEVKKALGLLTEALQRLITKAEEIGELEHKISKR